MEGRITLAVAGDVEPPPGVVGGGAACLHRAAVLPPVLLELEPSDHRYSSRGEPQSNRLRPRAVRLDTGWRIPPRNATFRHSASPIRMSKLLRLVRATLGTTVG